MILRKPYALLIRYFQRIHLILILLCAYVFYKISTLKSFVGNFINTESYNAYYEPISDYINFGLIISILLILVITITLIVLLIYKKKPWKIYILPVIEYIFMLGVLIYVYSFFNGYNEMSELTTIMAGRDLLNILTIPQYIIFIIFGIRFLGIDLKKFGFKEDEEYLDIKEEDREEFEVNIEFDKDKITRNIKRFLRNVKYVYFEHRLICNAIIIILVVSLSGYTYYYFGILHKTYREGNTFSANYYDITINDSYLTDKDSTGTVINENANYNFLILNITVKNKASRRGINIDRFRIMNKSNEFRYTTKDYDYFKNLGKPLDNTKELATNDERTFILVYRVDKDIEPNKFVLYYQDVSNGSLLKKVKLNAHDLRNLETVREVNINETMTFEDQTNITITSANLTNQTVYGTYSCSGNSCGPKDNTLTINKGKILELAFSSNTYNGESFVDFSNIHAKIEYENTKGNLNSIITTSLVNSYYGNYAYFRIPEDVNENGKINLVFTILDKKYIYHLK